MTTTPTITALCLASLVLTGCASADSPPDVGETPTAGAPPAESADLCDLLAPDDIGAAFGGDFGDGTPRFGQASANEVEWTTTGCSWESADAEVAASIAHGDDFAAGFECVAPSSLAGEVTPLSDLGDLAWWTWDDFQGGTGTVIICRDDTRIELAVEGPREGPAIEEATTRDGAVGLASRILASFD